MTSPELERVLERYLEPQWWCQQQARITGKPELTEEDVRRLRSLGYIR